MRGILAGHRHQLQGRFHLVVPLMQNLLRCLFLPTPVTGSKVETLVRIPPWLSADVATAPYATAYTRLLCMLCDPTASSAAVPGSRRRQELTPATTKVRRIAGQHLPYLLEEYIQCQLQHKLLPDVKSALTPGLYSVLSVSSPEILRMINASIDASGRALFKILYNDYGRFGKWDEH
jgi:nucleolar pre-ribosomal-associated protein 2